MSPSHAARHSLPAAGSARAEVARQLAAMQAADTDREHGAFALRWPTHSTTVDQVAVDAYAAYTYANLLFSPLLPGLNRAEGELKGFVASLLRAPDDAVVTLTAGGTESNVLAVRAARNRARAERGPLERPTLVVPMTAHPSFDKAADYMDLEIVRVAVRGDHRADAAALAAAVDEHTILVAGSAPSYTHGVMDPIAELAAVAREHGAWMHVDACVGGFLHPFLRQLGRPLLDFDFTVPGVDSISADLHKFGHAPHGISSLTLRGAELLEHQRYEMDDWPFGYYGTQGLLGTRPGGIVVGAWAVMVHLGLDGYLEMARRIAANAERLADGARVIDGLAPLHEPELGIVSIAGSDAVPIPALAQAMRGRDWPTFWSDDPQAIHLLSDPVEPELVDRYLADLAAAADDVANGRVVAEGAERATYAAD